MQQQRHVVYLYVPATEDILNVINWRISLREMRLYYLFFSSRLYLPSCCIYTFSVAPNAITSVLIKCGTAGCHTRLNTAVGSSTTFMCICYGSLVSLND